MGSPSNAVFAALVSGLLLSPACMAGAVALGADLPGWLTAEDAVFLSGGAIEADIASNLSLEGFTSKGLQSAIEETISTDTIPCKAALMLGNAAVQRSAIALANIPFGWECYPTYYNSSRIYIPSVDAVSYLPAKHSVEADEALRGFAQNIAAFAAAHPSNRFVVYAVQGYREPAANPAYQLTADSETPARLISSLAEVLDDVENVFLCTHDYDSVDKFYADFFRTDHHWNYAGITRAWNDIAQRLGFETYDVAGHMLTDEYMGATARWGLVDMAETTSDTSLDFSNLTVVSADGESTDYTHDVYIAQTGLPRKYGFYDYYYDWISPGSRIIGPGEGSALIVSNSFGAGLAPFVAEHYATTIRLNSIFWQAQNLEDRLDTIIAQNNIDDVIFVADLTDFVGFAYGCPDYFEIAE